MHKFLYISHARAEIYYRRWVVVAVVAVVAVVVVVVAKKSRTVT